MHSQGGQGDPPNAALTSPGLAAMFDPHLLQGEYGKSTYLVRSKADVRAVTTSGFGTDWVLQEFILGRYELCTSLLLKGGVIHEIVTTTYDYGQDEYIWPYVKEVLCASVHAHLLTPFLCCEPLLCGRQLTSNREFSTEIDPEYLRIMQAFLTDYEGICNFNYKVGPMEIAHAFQRLF